MPTSEPKKVLVNGKEEPAKRKVKVPPGVDWQAVVREKQAGEEKQE